MCARLVDDGGAGAGKVATGTPVLYTDIDNAQQSIEVVRGKLIRAFASAAGLNRTELEILIHFAKNPNASFTPNHLGEMLTGTNPSYNFKGLRKKGWIVSEHNQEDRRSQNLSLKPEKRAQLLALRAAYDDVMGEFWDIVNTGGNATVSQQAKNVEANRERLLQIQDRVSLALKRRGFRCEQ